MIWLLLIPLGYCVLLALFASAGTFRQGALLWALAIAAKNEQPFGPVVDAFAEDARGRWRRKLYILGDRLNAGTPLADALHQLPGLVPLRSLLAIRIGSESGALGAALRDEAVRCAAEQESRDSRHSAVVAYLCGVSFVLMAICSFVMYFIIPKFKKIFADFDVELPQITIAVIGVCDAFTEYYFLFVPIFFGAVWITIAGNGKVYGPLSRGPYERLIGMPPRRATPDILRSLALIVAASQPLAGLIGRLAVYHPVPSIKKRLRAVEAALREGHDCWHSLLQAGLITPGEAVLLESAERVGNLPWALRALAGNLERRRAHRVDLLMEWLRPAVIVCLGMVVAFFAVGFLMPVIKLINDLS